VTGDAAELWDDLTGCLDLAPAAGGVLEGRNLRLGYRRVFGGQLLAQFVQAAIASCPEKAVKSVHVLFPREGRTDEPVRYHVQVHHNGAAFAALAIEARQARGVIAIAAVSLHAAEDGPARQDVPPVPPVPGPEQRAGLGLLPWDTRPDADLDDPAAGPPRLQLWMRLPPGRPALGPALAAYATDLTLIGTALRAVPGVSQRDAGIAFTSAVTSHTIWFHRPLECGGWLLLRQHSPVMAGGRSFGRGDVLSPGGELAASYAQEALLRFTP
jgi:acyl-CoA thioesterase II